MYFVTYLLHMIFITARCKNCNLIFVFSDLCLIYSLMRVARTGQRELISPSVTLHTQSTFPTPHLCGKLNPGQRTVQRLDTTQTVIDRTLKSLIKM